MRTRISLSLSAGAALMAEASTTRLQGWIDRMRAGEPGARDELLNHACERLRRLTRKMLQDFARVRHWEDTDDVLQNALLRLWRALEAVPVASVQEFFRLAAAQIRRELIDLARHYYGPQGPGAKHATKGGGKSPESTPPPAYEKPTTTHEPGDLARWSEFHERIEALPDKEREVVDLLWYQGLTQAEAAGVLGISVPTVKRRWLAARLRLQEALHGDLPGM
jgi:RNA polymerase sigma-70 factor (ECF subfamily)